MNANQIDYMLHWDKLYKIGSSSLARSTIVIPIVGYLILFNAELSKHLTMTFGTEIIEEPTWRMYFLYFGMTCFAVGSGLFSLFCPGEVKEHGSAYDFVQKQAGIVNPFRLQYMKDTVLKHIDAVPQQSDPDEYFRTKKLRSEHIMTEYFELLEENNRPARVATAAAYLIGTVLLAVPTVITFFRIAWSIAA